MKFFPKARFARRDVNHKKIFLGIRNNYSHFIFFINRVLILIFHWKLSEKSNHKLVDFRRNFK